MLKRFFVILLVLTVFLTGCKKEIKNEGENSNIENIVIDNEDFVIDNEIDAEKEEELFLKYYILEDSGKIEVDEEYPSIKAVLGFVNSYEEAIRNIDYTDFSPNKEEEFLSKEGKEHYINSLSVEENEELDEILSSVIMEYEIIINSTNNIDILEIGLSPEEDKAVVSYNYSYFVESATDEYLNASGYNLGQEYIETMEMHLIKEDDSWKIFMREEM